MDFNQDELMQFFSDWTDNIGPDIWFRLIVAALIIIVGRWLARFLARMLERTLERAEVEETLNNFAFQVAYFALMIVVAVISLSYVGFPMTSVVAILGAAALAIGFALRDIMASIAAGIMIILLKPYQVEDLVEVAGQKGIVVDVKFFHTQLRTLEKIVYVPNNAVMANNIENFSRRDWMRIDLVVGIGYDDDLSEAKQILTDIVSSDPRIAEDPPPLVAVQDLAESTVNLLVAPFVKQPDMWDVRYYIVEQIKLRFDAAGISLPYPQSDVHVTNAQALLNGQN